MAVQVPVRAPTRARHLQPVQIAATAGAILACFELYLLIAWIAGPNFARVTPGPSAVPQWMRIAIWVAQALAVTLALTLIYRFGARPWRREQYIGFDGLLVLAAMTTSLYDPLNAYFHPWFAYNSYFFNRGTAMVQVPGWQSFHAPGAQISWPILFIPVLYAGMFLGLGSLGCVIIRRTSARWPRFPAAGHIAICFLAMCLIDAATEGPTVMRLGLYEHTGRSLSFLDSYYGHNAIRNIVFVGLTVTAAVCLRYYRNDRGETIVERGLHTLKIGTGTAKSTAMRFLAILAAFQAILLCGYHLPVAITTLITPNPTWHSDMTGSSYLNDHICGYGTPRICPPR